MICDESFNHTPLLDLQAGNINGCVACRLLRESFSMMPGAGPSVDASSSASRGGNSSSGNSSSMSIHGIPMEPINMMIKRIYKENASTLQNCAFVHGHFGFHKCIMALMDNR